MVKHLLNFLTSNAHSDYSTANRHLQQTHIPRLTLRLLLLLTTQHPRQGRLFLQVEEGPGRARVVRDAQILEGRALILTSLLPRLGVLRMHQW